MNCIELIAYYLINVSNILNLRTQKLRREPQCGSHIDGIEGSGCQGHVRSGSIPSFLSLRPSCVSRTPSLLRKVPHDVFSLFESGRLPNY